MAGFGSFIVARIASTLVRVGAREQTGSVAVGSPVSDMAWQRQPPKSRWRRSQDLQGSCIQSSSRNFWNAGEFSQISVSDFSFTFSNWIPGITPAAWQGSTAPTGETSMSLRPQPPTQGFGNFA